MTWNDAKYYCRQNNYTLISIETKLEDDLIHLHINNTECAKVIMITSEELLREKILNK